MPQKSLNKRCFVKGSIGIHYAGSLEELAELISNMIMPGVSFAGAEKFKTDEIPSMFIENVIGLTLMLSAVEKNEYYELSVFPCKSSVSKETHRLEAYIVDISDHIISIIEPLEESHEIELVSFGES